jgi:catechol 2,3-dioxygenase-like lactoylglutathione lyase family enzyme
MIPRILLVAGLIAGPALAQEPPPARPRITGVSHVALWVADLGRSRAFYKGYLGFDEPFTLGDGAGGVLLTWIKVNDRQTLELFPVSAHTPPNGDRLYHLALETDDAQGMLAYLRARGVKAPGGKPLPAEAKPGRIGNLNYFTEDPDGHIVEFTQYLPNGWTLQKAGQFLPPTRIAHRISHVGFAVGDLPASLRFYVGILGFREFWRGSSNGTTLSWVNLRVPDGQDYVELMLSAEAPSVRQLRILNHVCLEVPDAAAAAERLRTRTLPENCRAPDPLKTGVNRKRQLNAYDPDGTRIEMMEAATVDGEPAPSSTAPAPVVRRD